MINDILNIPFTEKEENLYKHNNNTIIPNMVSKAVLSGQIKILEETKRFSFTKKTIEQIIEKLKIELEKL